MQVSTRRWKVLATASAAALLATGISKAALAQDTPPADAPTEQGATPAQVTESTSASPTASEPTPAEITPSDAAAASTPGSAQGTQDSDSAATEAAVPADAAAPTEATTAETIPVAAEPQKAAESERATSANATRLEDVVVTATKREESVRKIAGTVGVVSGEQLEAIGARDMEDYLKLIPGVTLQEGDTNSSRTISIRGIGPQPGANTTTGVLIDNVSMSDPYASYLVPDLDPFDLKDLEVLKGPQGTLFGAGALNGAIRYVLNKPELGVTNGKGFVNYQDVSQGGTAISWGAALNIPLADKLAFRAVGVSQELPGLYDDVNANGKNEKDADHGDKTMYRLMGLWQPTDKFSVNAFYLRQHNFRNDLSIANNTTGEFKRTDTPGPSTSEQGFNVANLDLRYDFDWFSVISETSQSEKLQDINYDGSAVAEAAAIRGVASLRLHAHVTTKDFSQELRLVSAPSDSPWVWIGGVYYNRYTAHVGLNTPIARTAILSQVFSLLGLDNLPGDPINYLTPTPDGLSVEYIRYEPLQAQEESVFGELTRKLFDNTVEVTLGGRLYQEKLFANTTVDGVLSAYGAALGYSGTKVLHSKGFNPKGTVKWQITPDFLLYGSVAKGFQFGGLNAPAPLPTDNTYPLTFKPSTLWSQEIGVRTDWLDKTLQFDATVFLINWTDMQLSQATQSGNTDYTDNVGKARSIGLESSLRWLTPIPGLMLINAASISKATVEEGYTTANGDNITVGTDLPAAPHWQTSTTLAWNTMLGPLLGGPSVSYSRIGKAWNDIQHDENIFGFATLDANLKVSMPSLTFQPEITFGVNNILDERGVTGARVTHLANLPSTYLSNYMRPRNFALRLSGSF